MDVIDLENRTKFFEKAGPKIAKKMGDALHTLTKKKVAVGFKDIQTVRDTSDMRIDVDERCFGTYVDISGDISGVAIMFFPIKSISKLLELSMTRHFETYDDLSPDLKLSAFKELTGILISTYVSELANALKVKLNINPPKLAHFKSLKFTKSIVSSSMKPASLISIGHLSFGSDLKAPSGEGRLQEGSSRSFKGRFVIVF